DFLQLGFQGINLRDERPEAFDLALIFRADELFYDKTNHGYTLKTARRYGISGKPSKTFNNTPGRSKFKCRRLLRLSQSSPSPPREERAGERRPFPAYWVAEFWRQARRHDPLHDLVISQSFKARSTQL